MTTRRQPYSLLLAGLWIASAGAQTSNPYATPHLAPAPVTPTKGNAMDDLTAFATHGAKLLESVKGDLTGEGQGGALLVLDPPPTGNGKPSQERFRLVVLLLKEPTGQFRRISENGRLVPCSVCGGAAGDPYAYSRIGKGQFTVVVGGGSRERWSDEYSFTYQAAKRDWFVSSVTRKVFDTGTEKEKHIDLTTQELGTISFTDFDPSRLPEVTLP